MLDEYKDKDIILYCVVDVTSRNTEKLLRERGFTKTFILEMELSNMIMVKQYTAMHYYLNSNIVSL